MTTDQIILFSLFGAVFVFLLWGKFRYDLVAFTALLLGVVTGVVPTKHAFDGFGHPATLVVALVLVVSAGLVRSGAVFLITRTLVDASRSLGAHIALMGAIGGVLSGFMNNVAALALLMPVELAFPTPPLTPDLDARQLAQPHHRQQHERAGVAAGHGHGRFLVAHRIERGPHRGVLPVAHHVAGLVLHRDDTLRVADLAAVGKLALFDQRAKLLGGAVQDEMRILVPTRKDAKAGNDGCRPPISAHGVDG